MKIAITGHRPNKLGNDYDLISPLIQRIKEEIMLQLYPYVSKSAGVSNGLTLITGMALGIDTLFAKIAIENNIPFIAAIPCGGHMNKWPQKSQDIYMNITRNDLCTVNYVSREAYTNFCMQHRNEWMVDNCDLLIAVWDGTPGGTANCVKYAQEKGKEIVRINPNDFR